MIRVADGATLIVFAAEAHGDTEFSLPIEIFLLLAKEARTITEFRTMFILESRMGCTPGKLQAKRLAQTAKAAAG